MSSVKRGPGPIARCGAVVMALLLTAVLLLMQLMLPFKAVMTDKDMYYAAAGDQKLLSMQMTMIENGVNTLSEQVHFMPETVMAYLTEEELSSYGRNVADWWIGQFEEEPETDMPEWKTGTLADVIREDPVFAESVPSVQRRTVARDQVCYPVQQLVQKAVLPLRASLLRAGLPMIQDRVSLSILVKLVDWMLLILPAVAVFLVVMLLLCCFRGVYLAVRYTGASVVAAALLMMLFMGLMACLKLPARAGEISPVAEQLIACLGNALALRSGMVIAVMLVVGNLLMWLSGRTGKREKRSFLNR